MSAKNPLPPTLKAGEYNVGVRHQRARISRSGPHLSRDETALARKAVAELILRRTRCGEPVMALPELLYRLDDLLVIGCASESETATGSGELDIEMVGTTEAAALLHCTASWVRQIAPGLGGRLLGGQWVIPRRNVIEHMGGRKE